MPEDKGWSNGNRPRGLLNEIKADFHKQYVPEGMSKKDYDTMAGTIFNIGGISKLGAAPDAMAKAASFAGEKAKGLLSKVKSEINWGAWNEEIPKNKALIKEYHDIEHSSKEAGKWMKPLKDTGWEGSSDAVELKHIREFFDKGTMRGTPRPDLNTEKSLDILTKRLKQLDGLESQASKYQGTPEQFVQEQSSNFKKAFGDDAQTTFRGSRGTRTAVGDLAEQNGTSAKGSVFTADRPSAEAYAQDFVIQPKNSSGRGVLELLYKKSKNSFDLDAKRAGWTSISDEAIPQPHRSSIRQNQLPYHSTGDIAEYLQQADVDYATIRNVIDGPLIPHEVIVNHRPGNYLKSRWYNNGMFDMKNPNIYKSVAPLAIATTGAGLLKKKQNTQ
jgi:hypothetical protein